MAGMRWAQRRDPMTERAGFEPMCQFGLDPRGPVAAALASDDEQNARAIGACIVKGRRQHGMGIGKRITMKIDDPVGDDLAAPQALVPTAVERRRSNRACRLSKRRRCRPWHRHHVPGR